MLKKNITFENFEGQSITETHYFNLNKTQALKLVSGHGGMDKYLQEAIDKHDNSRFIDFVEELVLAAYGKRDPENPEDFDNSKETKEAFAKTPAFDELVYTLLTNEKEFTDFFYGILPKAMREELMKNPQTPQIAQNA